MTEDYISRVRAEARTAIHLLVKASGGEVTDRPLFRDEPHVRTIREPEPLAGIRAAVAFEREHRRRCLEYIRYAREDGLTWAQIAVALGLDAEAYGMAPDPAFRAYEYAVPSPAAADWTTWTCPSCRHLVRDYGPELGPYEAEQGHAEGCGRFAATVRAWDAQWDEEDGAS
jgi:hypothetical protein